VIRPPKHTISVIVAGQELRGATSYSIDQSLTDGLATYNLRVPFSRAAWDLLRPDRLVTILVDETAVVTGYIDDSDGSDDGTAIEIAGRNILGRLSQDCAPGINFAGRSLYDLISELAVDYYEGIGFANTRNRRLARGKGKKVRAASEPLKITAKVGTRIEPGQTRLAVITSLAEQAGCLVWESGDGNELIVGKPNYAQEIQYVFFRPAPGSRRAGEATIKSLTPGRSTRDRYSRVICVGSGAGTNANYGAVVASRYGEAKDNPATAGGEGRDFTAPKVLIVQKGVQSSKEAATAAAEEKARRDARGNTLTVVAPGHGQVVAGQRPTLFALDTLALVQDEVTGARGVYLLEAMNHNSGRGDGEETVLTLVKKGAALSR
jgi:prophage tail gpP-like protein